MSAVVQVEKCFVAVIEPLDAIPELRQSSLFVQDLGFVSVLYGNDDVFFENLEKAKKAGLIKLKSIVGSVAATFKYGE